MSRRVVSYFSCGAPSFASTTLALRAERLGQLPGGATEVVIAYCDTSKREHPDNMRFLREAEEYWQRKIEIIGNDEFERDPHVVFRKTRFLVGPRGARCTAELKKAARWAFQRPDDIVLLGYTIEEHDRRIGQIRANEPLTEFWSILNDRGLTRADCLALVQEAGIEMPAMYKLGYRNNNCIGCVKGQAGYWNKIRRDFPEVFAEMAKIERELGRQICKREWVENGERKLERLYLDELPPDLGRYKDEEEISCGILCQGVSEEFTEEETERDIEALI